MTKASSLCLGVAVVLLSTTARLSNAADFPTRPVRIVLPAAPGGAYDALVRGRGIGQALWGKWNQPVVVDNRPGASGTIGTEIVAKSAPDGHTLLLVTTGFVTNPFLRKKLPYHTPEDFTPIAMVGSVANVLVAHPSFPAKSSRELIGLGKAKGASLNYASSGPGSGGHLSMEQFKKMAAIDMTHVPYKSAGPAITAVISGEVPLMITAISAALPHVKGGRLKALAVTSAKRANVLPDVPTIREGGLASYEVVGWYGLFGPSAMQQQLVMKIHADVVDVLKNPDVSSQITSFGFELDGMPPHEFARFVNTELNTWGGLIRENGIRAD